MNDFFANLPVDAALRLEQLSRRAFDLREQAKRVLQPYGVTTAQALAERIAAGEVPEQPACEHALAAHELEQERVAVREQLIAATRELQG